MKRDMNEWMRGLSAGAERRAMLMMTYPGLALTGASVREMVTDAEVQSRTIMALAERYPSNVAVPLIMDLSVEAEAFGCTVRYADDEIPTVAARLTDSTDDVARITVPPVGAGRTSVYLETAEVVSGSISDRPVLGGIIGPYSLAGRLYDITEMMTSILIDPDGAHQLLEKCTLFLTEYARAFRAAGCNGIIIAEPAAGLLSSDQCAEFSSQYVRTIVETVQDDGFSVILHNCGNTVTLVDSMASTGAAGLHFGNAVDMEAILSRRPSGSIIYGNIDPAGILKNSTRERVYEETMELLDRTSRYEDYVLSSGCDVPPGTPLTNIDAFFRALDEYNKKRRQ